MDIGSVGEWVGGIASIVAAGVSIAALIVAMKANSFAREANKTSQKTLGVSHKGRADALSQAERARREGVASQLQAWWVGSDTSGWGVEVVNGSSGAAVFRDVVIDVKGDAPSIRIAVLPPGHYFVRAKSAGWDLPKPIVSTDGLMPITKSPKHLVTAMKFCDPLGSSWLWRVDDGLTEASSVA